MLSMLIRHLPNLIVRIDFTRIYGFSINHTKYLNIANICNFILVIYMLKAPGKMMVKTRARWRIFMGYSGNGLSLTFC